MNSEDARTLAAEYAVSAEGVFKRGMEAKTKEFVERGAEVYAKVRG